MAVTLGDPRGIGPEVVQRALAQERLDADITLIGPDDQIAKIPADHRVGVGAWGAGSGGREAGSEESDAGRLAGRAVEQARDLVRPGTDPAAGTGPRDQHRLQ